jgi:hypothetical protein
MNATATRARLASGLPAPLVSRLRPSHPRRG